MGERRPGPNLERTEAVISRTASGGQGAKGMAAASCFPPAMRSSLPDLLLLKTPQLEEEAFTLDYVQTGIKFESHLSLKVQRDQ